MAAETTTEPIRSLIGLPSLEAIRAEKERRKRMRAYRSDLVAFAKDCIVWPAGETLAPYQEHILAEFTRRHRVAVRAPHGAGKTCIAAIVILGFALTATEDWKVATTAGAWRQLTKYLWPEIHKWARRLRWDKLGRAPFDERSELLALSLKLPLGEAFAVASDQPALIEGAHATRILYVFDESKAIPAKTFDAAEGAFSTAGAGTKGEAFALAISTPGEPSGRFYEINTRKPGYEDWWVRHITRDEAITAGRMGAEWAEKRRVQWGETSSVYQNRVLGEFASADENSVIPLAWIEAANERWRVWQEETEGAYSALTAIGVDVGYTGEDQTVIAPRAGYVIAELRTTAREDTMQTTGRVVPLLRRCGGKAIVDVIGVGAGVVDRLREQQFDVVPFNASTRSDILDQSGELGFTNLRSAAWWHLRELLDPVNGVPVALPSDDMLTGDLTAPRWRVNSSGRIEVEPKDKIRERIGRSTDHGDAVVQAFALEILDPFVEPMRFLGGKPLASMTDEELAEEEQRRHEAAVEEVASRVRTQGAYWPGA